ncbi:MAG: PAS domain S-box protein, partial [Blastocatellia bacterium]|nr:PAS domain S-box protein [Blastocatellia bacterium]
MSIEPDNNNGGENPDHDKSRRQVNRGLRISAVAQHELIEKLDNAEKALSFLGLVVASSKESIVTVDFDRIITTWNPAAEELYGYTAAETIGKPLTMLTLPEDFVQLLANIEKIRNGELVELFETVRIMKGGDNIELEILLSPVSNIDGRVIGVATIARDITERVRLAAAVEAHRLAEREMKARELAASRANEMRLAESQMSLAMELSAMQRLQEVSTGMMGAGDPNTLYEMILDAAVEIMRSHFASIQQLFPERGEGGELLLLGCRGYTPEAAKHWEWVSALSECTCGVALRTGKRAVITNVEADETISGTADQAACLQTRILALQSTPLVSRGGQMLGMLSTHWSRPHQPSERDLRLLDVLARQAADLIERTQAEAKIRQSDERFRVAVEAVDSLIWTNNAKGEMEGKQAGWENFTGQTYEEYQGYGWSKAVHPEDARPTLDGWNEAVKRRETFIFEHRLRRRDGEWRTCSVRAVPVLASDGKIHEWVGVHADITESKRAEEELRPSRERLELRVKERTAELATVNEILKTESIERLRIEK